jgi:VWFA-related protein
MDMYFMIVAEAVVGIVMARRRARTGIATGGTRKLGFIASLRQRVQNRRVLSMSAGRSKCTAKTAVDKRKLGEFGLWFSRRAPHAGLPALFLVLSCFCGVAPSGEQDQAPASRPVSVSLPSVRFVSPSPGDVAYGETLLRVAVSPPPGVGVTRVDFYVDEELVGRDLVPPFQGPWDAGEGLSSHTYRATVIFSDGATVTNTMTSRGLALVEHEIVEGTPIEHVELLVSVVNRKGEVVTGLHRDQFEIRDGGSPVRILSFEGLEELKEIPLSISVLVDRSESVSQQMGKWREACLALLGSLRINDQVRVAVFADEMVILQDFTRDTSSLLASLEGIDMAGGATHLYRALSETTRDMRDLPGRKAVIVLTDGADSEFGLASGSFVSMHPILKATAAMASRAGVTVIVILPGPSSLYLAVQDLAAQTGGWWMYTSDDLPALMGRLGERLLGSYLISYDVSRPGNVDKKRSIKVKLEGDQDQGWKVSAALGTYASLELERRLKSDLREGNDLQRARAATELGHLGTEDAGKLLLKALDDRSPEVRRAVLGSLAELGEVGALKRVVARFRDVDRSVREAARAAAVRFGSPALPYLEEAARSRGPARADAVRAAGAIGDPAALSLLEEASGSRSCEERAAAADGAGYLLALTEGFVVTGPSFEVADPPWAQRILEKTLADPCAMAAATATVALGRLGHAEALRSLLVVASEDLQKILDLGRSDAQAILKGMLALLDEEEGDPLLRAKIQASLRDVDSRDLSGGFDDGAGTPPGS